MINVEQVDIAVGDATTYGWDASSYLTQRSTTISSVVWASGGSAVTISQEAATATTVQARLTGVTATECEKVTATITLANGDIKKAYFMVSVIDPDCEEYNE